MDFVIAWTFRELGAFYHYLLALYDSRIQWRTRTFYLKWGGLAEEVNPRIWMKFCNAESCVISWQDSNCVFSRLVIQWNRRKQPVCTWWFSWQLNCCVILLYYYYYFNHQLLVSDIFMAFVMYRDRCVFLVQSSFEGVQLLWFILPPKGNRSFCSKDCLVKSSSSSLLCWFLSYFQS